MTSIIQGSAIDLASFVVTASDLHPKWADVNSVKQNRTKSAEIVLVPPRSRHALTMSPTAVAGFEPVMQVNQSARLDHQPSFLCRRTRRKSTDGGLCAYIVCFAHSIETSQPADRCTPDYLPGHRHSQAGIRFPSMVALCQRIVAFLRRSVHFGNRADTAPTTCQQMRRV